MSNHICIPSASALQETCLHTKRGPPTAEAHNLPLLCYFFTQGRTRRPPPPSGLPPGLRQQQGSRITGSIGIFCTYKVSNSCKSHVQLHSLLCSVQQGEGGGCPAQSQKDSLCGWNKTAPPPQAWVTLCVESGAWRILECFHLGAPLRKGGRLSEFLFPCFVQRPPLIDLDFMSQLSSDWIGFKVRTQEPALDPYTPWH